MAAVHVGEATPGQEQQSPSFQERRPVFPEVLDVGDVAASEMGSQKVGPLQIVISSIRVAGHVAVFGAVEEEQHRVPTIAIG